jgi:hypothetical protein
MDPRATSAIDRVEVELGPQLFATRHKGRPTPARLRGPRKERWRQNKPRGGLWTSTLDEAGSSAWIRWCEAQAFWGPRRVWRMEVGDARLFELDGAAQLRDLVSRFPLRYEDAPETPGIDWVRVASAYDGVHVTAAAMQNGGSCGLSWWDCESTVWFRWCFGEVREWTVPQHAVERDELGCGREL